jgi:hypothetical protein
MNDTETRSPEPAWPADGPPAWAPKFRWVALILFLLFVSIVGVWIATPMHLSEGYNF